MANVNKTDVVRKGDSPWRVAQRNLNNSGKKVSNDDITKEMKRLAELNGCDNVEDFGKKFFYSVGKEIVLEKTTPASEAAKVKAATPKRKTQTVKIQRTKVPADTSKAAHALRINKMENDAQRIIEHNKTNYQGQYYGIVDKKSCQLKIYNKEGKVIKTFTVGVGKTKGDGIGQNYLDHHEKTKDAWKAEQSRLTTAGEFTLDDLKSSPDAYTGKDGKPKVMGLKGDNKGVRGGQLAIHMLYKPSYAQRKAAIDSPDLADNRMSYGCVNLTEEDYDIMHQYLEEGDKIYILPEEKGNKLQLEKQQDGSYKFEQIYHKKDPRSKTKEQASRVRYDVRPDRNPVLIAKREAAKKAKEEQAKAEQAKTEQANRPWYDIRSWWNKQA